MEDRVEPHHRALSARNFRSLFMQCSEVKILEGGEGVVRSGVLMERKSVEGESDW